MYSVISLNIYYLVYFQLTSISIPVFVNYKEYNFVYLYTFDIQLTEYC